MKNVNADVVARVSEMVKVFKPFEIVGFLFGKYYPVIVAEMAIRGFSRTEVAVAAVELLHQYEVEMICGMYDGLPHTEDELRRDISAILTMPADGEILVDYEVAG